MDANGVVVETSLTAFQVCKGQFAAQFNTVELRCGVDRATSIIVDFIVALALLYFVVTYILLALKLKGYRKQPYASVQVGLVYNTLQVLLAPEFLLPLSIPRCNTMMLVVQTIATAIVASAKERFHHTQLAHALSIATETVLREQ